MALLYQEKMTGLYQVHQWRGVSQAGKCWRQVVFHGLGTHTGGGWAWRALAE